MLTPKYIVALLNTGWRISRTGPKSSWYRVKQGPGGGRHMVEHQIIANAINAGLIEYTGQLQLGVRVREQRDLTATRLT